MTTPILTFATTHHALWAEELARTHGVPAEIVPAPAEANARCGLALQTLPDELDRLCALLRAEAVPFAVHRPGG